MLFLLLSLSASAYYFRVWDGYSQARYSNDEFASLISNTFIQATVTYAQTPPKNVLVAYDVVLPTQNATDRHAFPQETALIVYTDEPSYNAKRATASGREYSAAHASLFDMSISHSTVPTPFTGTLGVGESHALWFGRNHNVSWASPFVSFALFTVKDGDAQQPPPLTQLASLLKQLSAFAKRQRGSWLEAIVRVELDFFYMYTLFATDKARTQFNYMAERVFAPQFAESFAAHDVFSLDVWQGPGNELSFGSGVSVPQVDG